MLGGVEIPGERGLEGHSDADVVAHAVIDAVLGAAGLGDIGDHFPDDDPRYEGRRQHRAARAVVAQLAEPGWRVVERRRDRDRRAAAAGAATRRRWPSASPAALGVDAARVNVKATTNEGMGFIGRGEGIAALAVAQIERAASDA